LRERKGLCTIPLHTETAPAVLKHPGTTAQQEEPVDTPKIHRDPAVDHHPHACLNGFVYMGYTVHDEEIGDEAEKLEVIPCRRCAER